ncbi:PEP-CTERM sorting domain-containing protein [Burkholderiaceae bacterium UC74_6]
MKAVPTRLIGPALAALLAAAAPSAYADYSATATAGANASMYSGTVSQSPANVVANSTNPFTPLQVTNQATVLGPGVNLTESAGGTGTAVVGPGALHLSVYGAASVQGTGRDVLDPGGASGYGYAAGSFKESLVWNVAGLAAGTVVTMDFQIRLDGSTGVNTSVLQGGTASGFRIYDWDLRFFKNADLSGVGFHSVTNSDQQDNFGIYDFSTSVVVGAPMTLALGASVGAGGTAGVMCSTFWSLICDEFAHGATAAGFADLSHTLAWNGVTGLHLGDTAISLSELSVTSDSGFDYTQAYLDDVQAVPEPSSLALVAAGLLLLSCLRARARRTSARPRRFASCVATLLLLLTFAAPSRAGLVLTLAPAPGTDLSNVHVGDTLRFLTLGSSNVDPTEHLLGMDVHLFGSGTGDFTWENISSVPGWWNPLGTNPVLMDWSFTTTVAGTIDLWNGFSDCNGLPDDDWGCAVTNLGATRPDDSNHIRFLINDVPEPTSIALAVAGCLALGFSRRKGRSSLGQGSRRRY